MLQASQQELGKRVHFLAHVAHGGREFRQAVRIGTEDQFADFPLQHFKSRSQSGQVLHQGGPLGRSEKLDPQRRDRWRSCGVGQLHQIGMQGRRIRAGELALGALLHLFQGGSRDMLRG